MQKVVVLVLGLIFCICQSTIYYVNPHNYISDGGGRKWDQAFLTLEDALLSATKRNDEIWLFYNYTYYPSTSDRFNCFKSSIGVSIYGGFIGTETDKSQRIDSYFDLYPSIISGNINNKDIATDNCYNVLTYQQQLTLDGLIISDGYANLGNKYLSQQYVLYKYGGALITSDGSKKTQLSINNVKFINNVALNGGALWFMSNNVNHVNVLITNCQFIDNIAINGQYEGGYGAAIYLYFMSNITIINSKFINNIAKHKGGAIYQDYGGILECNHCQFINNHVINGYGGALFAEDRNSQTEGTFPLIQNSYFYNNTASFYGGAICYFNDVIAKLFINNSFESNTVYNGFGGAIALIGSQIVDLYSNNNKFTSNEAILNPKTNTLYNISYDEYDEIDINLTLNVTFYLNKLWDKYQLIMDEIDVFPSSSLNEICYVNINNSNGINNGSSWNFAYQTIQECIDDLNENSNGGEIWVAFGHYIPTSIPSWRSNAGKTSNIHKSFVLYENIRIYGGFNGTETIRSQRNFYKNPTYLTCELPSKVASSGYTYCYEIVDAADDSLIDGFIFIKAQNEIKNNEMNRRRLSDTDSLSVVEILSSTAGNSGGGIYSNSTTITVVNSIFYKLFSSGKGGAIYCIGLQGYPSSLVKAPTIINSAFIGNRAAARGGAISADVECNFICKYCIFDSNSCSKKGGAVYLDFNSDPIFENSEFINNYALESGGCLAEDGESNTTFIGNTLFNSNGAKWEGGCLYSGSGVGPGIVQGFIFNSDNITFNNNYLFNGDQSGENNIYLWPYNIIDYNDITYSPTPQPTDIITSKPTESPLGNYTFNKPPNFIIFVIDDILYTTELNKSTNGAAADTHLYHQNVSYLEIPLPNLQEFVSESIVFPRSYCGGPKCSPARFSILTGRHVSRSQFARHRTLQTSSGYFGTNITIQTSKLLYNDSIYNIPYQLQNNPKQKYFTGMVGKWHLMSHDDNGYNLNCSTLNYQSDPQIYENCINVVKAQGFDFVDAYYHENINVNATYGHNPEWIINRAQSFIDQSIENDQPFFLYAAHTLTHDPEAYVSMFNFSINDTPKGILSGDEIPINTGMHSRQYLWQKAVELGFTSSNRLNFAAMDIWVDDSLGALINYLKDKDLYDNTFFVVLNDHGMGSKGTLYEQGTRIWQFIRFPPLFNDNGHILTDDYITSPTDLASVIFDIANISNNIDSNYIMDDSINWIPDIIQYIDNDNNANDNIDNNECCSYRFVDIHNSHSIITKDWKYIYRATDVVETDGDVCDFYIYCYDYQQLYYLPNDPNEQNNLIHNLNESTIYNDILYDLQSLMIQYIQNVTCPIEKCKVPQISFTKTPSNQPTHNPTTYHPTTYNPTHQISSQINTSLSLITTIISTNATSATNAADENGNGNKNTDKMSDNMTMIIIIGGSVIGLIIIVIIALIHIKRKRNRKIDETDGYVRMVAFVD